jgi:iron complex transport system substrate-binding protein
MKAFLLLLCLALPIMGKAFVVTDLSGRQVTFQKQPQKIMLSEGRMLYLFMALQPKHVDNKIVAMADDLKKADTDTWSKVTQLFPRLLTIPIIASPATGQFSAEQAFSLRTDLVLFSLSQLSNLKRSNTLQHLDALNINSLFIDYRANLTEHLLPTMALLGPIFGQQEQALKFQQFIQKQRDIITTRLAQY